MADDEVYNPIYIGFAWSQRFSFPVDFFQPGDGIRAEFRRNANDPVQLMAIGPGVGATIAENILTVSLTPAQTKNLHRGALVTNFVLIRSVSQIPIASVVRIPVTLLPTRPVS